MIPYGYVKRGIDMVGAAGALVVASPLMAVTAALVAKNLGRPILFTQERPGRGGQVFRLYKFRSMRDLDPGAGLVSDETRLTDFGKWLRSTSLDELPSLINVLKGDMSFIGPRPLLVSYLERYSSRQAQRHEIRPGITGWAQVNGRNAVDWPARLELDVQYAEAMSFAMDMKILAKTVTTVLARTGISADGYATMCEFQGESDESATLSSPKTLPR